MNLDELTCKVECQELVARYFILLDRGPRAELPNLFTDDPKFITPDGNVTEGGAVHGLLTHMPENFVPVHLAVNVVITPAGPDAAEGLCYGVAYNMFGKADDVLPRKMPNTPNRIGKIDFRFRKTAKGWRISQFKVNVAFIDDGLT